MEYIIAILLVWMLLASFGNVAGFRISTPASFFETSLVLISRLLGWLFSPFDLFPKADDKGDALLSRWKQRQLMRQSHRDFQGYLLDGVARDQNVAANLLVCAPTGAGKSSTLFLPNALAVKERGQSSLVLYDPKLEIYTNTAHHLQKNGFTILIFKPDDASVSCRFDPVLRATNDPSIRRLCELVIPDPPGTSTDNFWTQGARDCLFVLTRLLNTLEPKYRTLVVARQFANIMAGTPEVLQPLVQRSDPSLQTEFAGLISLDMKVLSSFLATLKTNLSFLLDKESALLTCGDEVPFEAMRYKKTALFIAVNERNLSTHSVLISVLLGQLYDYLFSDPSIEWDKKRLSVAFLLDEFGVFSTRLGKDLDRISSLGRAFRISTLIGIQSLSQLQELGEFKSRTILSNFTRKVFFGTSDPYTLDLISKMSGQKKVGESSHYTVPLLTPSFIRKLGRDRAVYFIDHHPVFIRKLIPYFKNKHLLKFTKKKAVPPKRPSLDEAIPFFPVEKLRPHGRGTEPLSMSGESLAEFLEKAEWEGDR